MFMPGAEPMRIPASETSPLAVSRGTVCMWLNMAWDGDTILKYNNSAVQFKVYRRHFQPRFKGEGEFNYSTGILDCDWPKYDMREWAFYPHVKAAVGDSEWHHFAVAYDDRGKKIVGWRDGELISVVDLSTVATEPLVRDGLENPKLPIRMVDHWSYFRGFLGDKWRGDGRNNSIFSWEELRTGDTKLIRDWVRLMASAGWNALCPSEVNWCYRDNFLDHLDEVETLANICRDYGMKLYWSPSYLLALEQETADALYARVPDFGGYIMKMGSEKQNGDPRPPMVNRIADTLKPHGGRVLVRAFVYGNLRYTPEPYRNLIPYDLFAHEDGIVENKTPFAINRDGIGVATPALRKRLLAQYAPGLRELYGDPLRGEEFLTTFHFAKHDQPLSIGRTLIQDVYGNMEEAVEMAEQAVRLWKELEDKIDRRRYQYMLDALVDFAEDARDAGAVLKALSGAMDPWEPNPNDQGLMDPAYYHWEASLIWGKPGSPIENISFKNVQITVRGGYPASEASLDPEENDERFPRKVGPIPAYAWYLRHVKNACFFDCTFPFEKEDGRPAVVIEDGEKVVFENCDMEKGAGCGTRIAFPK